MNAVLEKLSPEDYLARERSASDRTEYIQGETRNMTGASYKHNLIVSNIHFSIKKSINSSEFITLTSDMKVWIPSKEVFYYPDILILPTPPEFYDNQSDIITNPICIIEVLSASTRNFDKAEKFDNYRSISGFKEYFLVEQDKCLVTQYIRNSKSNWEMIEYNSMDDSFSIDCVGIKLQNSEVYQGV